MRESRHQIECQGKCQIERQKEWLNKCQDKCQKWCTIECQNRCRIECQKECQIDCQGISQNVRSNVKTSMPHLLQEDDMSETMSKWFVRAGIARSRVSSFFFCQDFPLWFIIIYHVHFVHRRGILPAGAVKIWKIPACERCPVTELSASKDGVWDTTWLSGLPQP